MASKRLMLSPPERRELSRRLRSRRVRSEDARRADVILRSARGQSVREIAGALGCSTSYVQRWTNRFRQTRLSGLVAQHRGRKARANAAALEAKVLDWTRRGPDDGSTHWSSRRLARKLGVRHMSIARIWRRHGLQPHRLRHFMASNDPAFEAKAADIIGLYLAPPAHAAVFCVDEKSAIQALDRLDPVLPLSPGRAERHGLEYFRHGTLSLYAALETKSGQVLASTARRHTSAEFVRFIQEVVATQPLGREIHVVADNLSAHKTKLVDDFLAHHPQVRLHFTPTYSSWLNQVENWFSKVQRHVIVRGIFESVTDLRRKLMRYIKAYNKTATPLRWTYSNPTNRIAA
jgi:transposase